MNQMYSVNQAAALYNVSYETIRRYTLEFADYLSPTANPQAGRQRLYSEEDMKVFSLVVEMKTQGNTYDDIHVALKRGERGKSPDVQPDQLSVMLNTEHEQRLARQMEYLQRELETVKSENTQLQEQLQKKSEEGLTHKIEAKLLREQLEKSEFERQKLQDEIKQLQRELGRLEGKDTHSG